jgi:glycosyltransferase involved in cell wall biosynthesis
MAERGVLHLYAGNLYGGVERLLVSLASAGASAAGPRPRYALCFEGRLAAELRGAGAGPSQLPPVRMSHPWTVARARRGLAELLRGEPPRVVVCHGAWTHAAFAPAVRRAGLPLVHWMHDAARGTSWAERLARRTPPDAVLCTSAYAAATLPRLWPHVPSHVVYPPVPPPRPSPGDAARTRALLGASPGEVVVLQASRMEAWKGHEVLLRALGRLGGEPGWRCWIAGGAQRPVELRHLRRLRALAERLGIASRVHFLGEREDLDRVMAAADLFCQPNLLPEPFGMVFVEAMHAGLPVVGSRSGGTREVVDASCGVLVSPGDAAALADALEVLVRSPVLRRRLGSAGPPRARLLADPARQAARLHAALDELLREGRG